METETKRERFIRCAELRTNKVLDSLRVLGNCSNRSNYEYTEEDIEKIFGTIAQELESTKNKFLKINDKKGKFTLG